MSAGSFKFAGPKHVISDEGFSVRRKARSELVYEEGSLSLPIEVESGRGLAVYFSASTKSANIDRDALLEIRKRIESALVFMGGTFEII